MSYFKRFPYIKDYELQGRVYTGMDITRRTGIKDKDLMNPDVYIEYDVGEGETPEMLADRVYDDASLYWVIMMFNDIHDIASDWPLTQVSLDRYVSRLYDNVNDIHHYKSAATGAWVDSDHPDYDRVPVTNYEYEIEVNENKRRIRVPTPSYVGNIVSQHNELIKQ